ncbi:periplasmic protein thiol/disulfide oxidoreductase DsbE [Ancylobacter novellus DSM 506]|uniref:Periplasmic protein thiol/disulfide oxidoreductase DsbE n=1 Tax=Ancylobacter novellus (strain ATCC 8093 / DSM 506 / JCM 20403 / CCM 1077 / IAM 12100 / NBRC 12443 / NCIMB 10456) TaxID=639283 RepID=D7A5V4_ANCN5|nr:DsbE family thiol:disulfide interchange protein [Ancylobacter novellus]ADH90069.1 periplasmic protein thiol/disulfide oxidoreductase DsbE [Ancylobacter novellus DSM 506]
MSDTSTPSGTGRRRLLVLLPLIAFVALAALFYGRLFSGDPSRIPSALIGRPAPALDLPPLQGLTRDGQPVPGLTSAGLKGEVTVLNVFASWCVPCRDEHPFLVELSKMQGFRLVGLNYKDEAENARRFLGRFGNPYAAVGVDAGGRAAIDWGVYGVPETFVIGRDGRIAYKFIGPIDAQGLKERLLPEIEKAKAPPAS